MYITFYHIFYHSVFFCVEHQNKAKLYTYPLSYIILVPTFKSQEKSSEISNRLHLIGNAFAATNPHLKMQARQDHHYNHHQNSTLQKRKKAYSQH